MDFDRLWDELVHIGMYPPKTGVLKASQLTKHSDSEFTVVQTLQPDKGKGKVKGKAKGKGKGKGAGVTTTATLKFKLDKEKGEMYRESYGQMGKLIEKVWIV